MIKHRPLGSGHPYSVDTDQRSPVDPIASQPLDLGVRSTSDVEHVDLVYQLDGVAQIPLALLRTQRKSRGQVLDGGHLASAQARLARQSGGWTVQLNGLKPGQKFRYKFVSNSGSTRWFETSVYQWQDADLQIPTTGKSRLIGGARVLTDGAHVRAVKFQLELTAAERVTGFGERFEAAEFRGAEVSTILFEQYKNQGKEGKTYMPMAFAHVVGGEGWGFWIDSYRKIVFDIAKEESNLIQVTVDVDGLMGGPFPPDVHFFDGLPSEVLNAFLNRCGRPEELPEWVFGLWASANEWNTQAEVLRQANFHRDHDIPFANLVIEAWSDESTFTTWRDAKRTSRQSNGETKLNDFSFPKDGAWPNPKEMVDDLHSRGVKVHLWQIPLLKMRPHPKGPLGEDVTEALEGGHLIAEENSAGVKKPYRNRGWWFPLGLMPDLTDPESAKWWTDKRRYLVRDLDIDGFKTDGGEHAWGRELIYKNGKRGDEMNWKFPVHYAEAYGNLLRSEGKAPVTFSRAGNVGSQAHGAFWAGDENSTWEAFRWSLNAGLTASASGIFYWGWDLAGFSGDVPSSELYLRSAATACFVPIMQYHSEFNHHRMPSGDRTPWNIADRHTDPSVIDKFRDIVRVRERLRPYLANQMAKAVKTGKPLMRPLYFDSSDPAIWDSRSSYEWRLGDNLLVAPIVNEGALSRIVWLPSGSDWVDIHSGESHHGGNFIEAESPAASIPVFVRASAWLEMKSIFQMG